jgi:amino-acid N-acetyltransferase
MSAVPDDSDRPAFANSPAGTPAGELPAEARSAKAGQDHEAHGAKAGPEQFVAWLREVAPYVHAHRGRTFVVGISGELIDAGRLDTLVHDLSLLHAMGIRLVLVHGSRPQVERRLALRQLASQFSGGLRITDEAALECVREAAGSIRLGIEAAFSQGLPNTPMANSRVRIISGNFVVARPVGIVDGIDFRHTGVVRKVDVEAIRASLANDNLVLLPPLGFSPTGEAFNLAMQDVAASAAVALRADKLVLIGESGGLRDAAGGLVAEIPAARAEQLLAAGAVPPECAADLACLVLACRGTVARAHLLPSALDGGLLIELFTHDGAGTLVTKEDLEHLREASVEDVGSILRLIEPLEEDGTLVKRPRELIEREIARFSVLEHDGVLFGCAALYPFPLEEMGEMACLTVQASAREAGDGERLLRRIEARAREAGLKRLFVLTTRTAHWFLKRGFVSASVDDLPAARKDFYNWQRRSQVLVKNL